eukprot:2548835-Amphidinium_carterae.1
MESQVSASEVEFHIEPGVAPSPAAPECMRQMELDSDTDTEDEACFEWPIEVGRGLVEVAEQGAILSVGPK